MYGISLPVSPARFQPFCRSAGLNGKSNNSKEEVRAEMKVVVSPGAMEAESFPRGRYGGGLGAAA